MSPRAASRLESLGFTEVFKYAAGKADWFAFGLPGGGDFAAETKIGDLVNADVPSCAVDDQVSDIAQRIRALEWEYCVVIDPDGVVIGELEPRHLDARGAVGDVMQEGPRTFRPDVSVEQMAEWFRTRERVQTVLVTTSDGRLLGILSRATVHDLVHESHATGE